jgi:hypothetical protein
MWYQYKWGLIDANYILFRNKAVLGGNECDRIFTKAELFTSIVTSLIRLKKDGGFLYPVLIWDKSPYYKLKTIKAYKSDRWRPTEEEYQMLEAEKAGATLERLAEIEKQQQKIRTEQANFETTQQVKALFLSPEFRDFGFVSLAKQGYEADDLAFLAATYISEQFKLDRNNNAVLLTADKDWANFQLPGVDFLSTYNWSNYRKLTDEYLLALDKINQASKKLYGDTCKLSRYQYGILEELMHKSHNNACVWSHKGVNRHEAIARLLHNDESLIDFQPLHDAYFAMNMLEGSFTEEYNFSTKTYVEDTKALIESVINPDCFYYKPGAFRKYCNQNFLDPTNDYADYITGFKNI